MKTSQLQYELDESLIATEPVIPQHNSKLLILDRKSGKISHKHFHDLSTILTPNDVLVFNQSKVIKSIITGQKTMGKMVDVLLVEKISNQDDQFVIYKSLGKNINKKNLKIKFSDQIFAEVIDTQNKFTILKFNVNSEKLDQFMQTHGKMPIPPYIRKKRLHQIDSKDSYNDELNYQTSYAKDSGSIAAPTAGLHFTNTLLDKLKSADVKTQFVTLHVGMGTFEPIQSDELSNHNMHSEKFTLSSDVAQYLNNKKKEGKRIIAVGTTTVRVLETCARPVKHSDSVIPDSDPGSIQHQLTPQSGETDIFIYPPYKFKFVDGIITNFHLPGSTLLALIMAFCGDTEFKSGQVGKAYSEAISNEYRFYSYGDGMLIT